MEKWRGRVQRLCICAALALTLCVLLGFAVCGLLETAVLHSGERGTEQIDFVRDSLGLNLAATAALIALLLGLSRLVRGRRGQRALLGVCAALTAAAMAFLLGAGTRQTYDTAAVLEAAQLFAQGNYKAMQLDYFHVYSYQLGLCLPMEIVLRLFPGLDINLFMQGLGVVLSAASAAMLAVLAGEVFGGRAAAGSTLLLGALFLPALLYPVFTYSTLPMLFCVTAGLLCFARYLRTRRARDGIAYAVMMALGYMLKPNAALAILVTVICALLDALGRGRARVLLYAALAAVLGAALARTAIWQYELRSGVTLTEDVSMLARLVMGLQEGGAQAGWYNSYTQQFFPRTVTAQQEHAVALADLVARLHEMAAQPAMTADFFGRKLLSQWLEPTCATLWYGQLGGQSGPLAVLAQAVYAQGGAVRTALEAYMNVFQQALYLLACVGLLALLWRGASCAQLLLPLTVLGGVLYHGIFEAKSQYAFIYLMLLLPVAAQGLVALEACIGALWDKRRRKRHGTENG